MQQTHNTAVPKTYRDAYCKVPHTAQYGTKTRVAREADEVTKTKETDVYENRKLLHSRCLLEPKNTHFAAIACVLFLFSICKHDCHGQREESLILFNAS